MPRVFIVSSLPAVRAGLRALVEGDGDCQVVGEAERPESAVAAADSGAEVLLVDAPPGIEVADLQGTEATLPVVLLGPLPGDERIAIDLAGRPWAYLARHATAPQLTAGIHAVASGLTVVDVAVGGHLLSSAALRGVNTAGVGDDDLTSREREVLDLIAQGLPNKAIAARLRISEHTVKFHVAAILAKLGASSRTEAVHLGARRGLVAL